MALRLDGVRLIIADDVGMGKTIEAGSHILRPDACRPAQGRYVSNFPDAAPRRANSMSKKASHRQSEPAHAKQNEELHYELNKKHKNPWQLGKNGTPCPPVNVLSLRQAMKLLKDSVLVGDKRFAIFNGRAFAAQEHLPGRWHGYPVGWIDVDSSLRNRWRKEGLLKIRDEKRFWRNESLPEYR